MSYSEKFSAQWDKLTADFSSEFRSLSAAELTEERVNKWLRARAFRWNSIVETEGLLLDHENNPALKSELTSALAGLSLKGGQPVSETPFIPFAVLAAVGDIAAVLAVKRYNSANPEKTIGIFLTILAVIAITAAIIIIYTVLSDNEKKSNGEKLYNNYLSQLGEKKKEMLEICCKYEK